MSRGPIDYSENFLRDIPDPNERRQAMMQEKLSAVDKDRLAARKRELEEKVSQGMPTHTEMWKPTLENCHKHLAWERSNAQAINELKTINRRLAPDNPDAGRIEYLRRQGEADKLAQWS